MTKYTSNEQYEKDKAKVLDALNSFSVYSSPRLLDKIEDLLEQSKWSGAPDNKPIPVVKDKAGKLTKDYSTLDWLNKLNEKLDEVKLSIAMAQFKVKTAEEITAVTIEYIGNSKYNICFYVNGGEAFNVGRFNDEEKALEAFNHYIKLANLDSRCPIVDGLKDLNKYYE